MSGRVFVEVRCDAEPDGPQAPPCMTPAAGGPGISTLRALRAELHARHGWHRSKGRDICPVCWAEGLR